VPVVELAFRRDVYEPAAVREAVRAFRSVCRLAVTRGRGAIVVRLVRGAERDLLEFANYALVRSLQIRRRIASGSTNRG
jgi:hypothetical protein